MLSLIDITSEWLTSAAKIVSTCLAIYALARVFYNRHLHPYKDVPGPFWASITSLWYARSIRYGLGDNTQWPIHRKYGPMVRLAPNMVSIADPNAIETIYGARNVFQKTSFYDSFNSNISPRRDGFCDRDDDHHKERRRIIQPLYSQQQVLNFEARFDRIIELFYNRMAQYASTNETIDMSKWLTRYTFDIIGELFYGREGGFGMLRDDIDYNGWCHLMNVMPSPASAVSYVPWGLQTLYLASQLLYKESRDGVKGFYEVIRQAHVATKQKLDDMASPTYKPKDDILSRLMNIVQDRGDKLNFQIRDVTCELWAIIWAGSDTTAIALSSIFWHLHQNPHSLSKLLAEIDQAFANGNLTYPVRYSDAIKLKYLWAVVQESMRIHPSLGTGLPRIVPPGGVEISSRFIPAGCHVTMSAMVVHFDKVLFGDDCHDFVPERWLRGDAKQTAEMERHMLQFGHGPRWCQGRHITDTEMYKLLPTILRDFKFELLTEDWKPFRGWFQNPTEIKVKVSKRRDASDVKLTL